MIEQVLMNTQRGQIEWSLDRPPGFKLLRKSVERLVYPWEVAGLGDWDVPLRIAPSGPDEEEKSYEDLPHVDLMPTSRAFLWLYAGDVRRENQVEPGSWPKLPRENIAPEMGNGDNGDPSTTRQVPPVMTAARRAQSRWRNVFAWSRTVSLTDAQGAPEDEPLYLTVTGYAGRQRRSVSDLAAIVSSLRYRYVT